MWFIIVALFCFLRCFILCWKISLAVRLEQLLDLPFRESFSMPLLGLCDLDEDVSFALAALTSSSPFPAFSFNFFNFFLLTFFSFVASTTRGNIAPSRMLIICVAYAC